MNAKTSVSKFLLVIPVIAIIFVICLLAYSLTRPLSFRHARITSRNVESNISKAAPSKDIKVTRKVGDYASIGESPFTNFPYNRETFRPTEPMPVDFFGNSHEARPIDDARDIAEQTALDNLAAEDDSTKVLAIEFLGQYGSQNAKERVKDLAFQSDSPIVKQAAIRATNWDYDGDSLEELANNETDPSLQHAIVEAANSAVLSEESRGRLDSFFMNSLTTEDDPDVIYRIISYFHSRGTESLIQAYSIILSRPTHYLVQLHMRDLAKGTPELFELFPALQEQL